MLFSSTFFLFIFLPTLLVLYFAVIKKFSSAESTKHRNILLLIASLIFYAWGEPIFVLVMMLCIGANYGFGLLADQYRHEKDKMRWVFTGMLVFNLGILGIFKYAGFIVSNLNGLLGLSLDVPSITLPIGISFFTFQGISYVVDVYRGHGKVLKNPLDVGLYISFFPQLIAGPIVRYETVAKEIEHRTENEKDFVEGIARFIIGMAKKVILANQFALIADKAYSLPVDSLSIGFAWMGAIAYMLQIFFDFAGYSDMAIGLGKMFGFHFTENFNAPYSAKSVSDFWRRWHISLGSWFRDYVYIPLGGSRTTKLKMFRNIFVVWLLTGIWHGANWTFIVWGVYFGVILVIEKFTSLGKFMEKSKVIGHIYTLILVLISWVIFKADSLSGAINYMKAMIGMGSDIMMGSLADLYLKDNFILYIVGMVACMPLIKWYKKLYEAVNSKVSVALQGVNIAVLGCMFLVAISYLVKGTYNPFIYFNF